MLTAYLIAAAFFASFMSGIYGMTGTLILLAIYLALLPVAKAMLLHGLVMLTSNASRLGFTYRHLVPSLVITSAVVTPLLCLLFMHFQVILPKAAIYLLIGISSFIIWLPHTRYLLPVERKRWAVLPAIVSPGFTLTAGASGPVIDALLMQTGLSRQQIIGNRAYLQVLANIAKIVVFGGLGIILMPHEFVHAYTPLLLGGCFVATLLGTWASTYVLKHMSDDFFRRSTRWVVTAIALYYLIAGAVRLIEG